MMDRKRQLIEELLQHLEKSDGDEFGALLESSKKPPMPEAAVEAPAELEAVEPDAMAPEAIEGVEAVAPEAQAGMGGDMSDDELAELLKQYLA